MTPTPEPGEFATLLTADEAAALHADKGESAGGGTGSGTGGARARARCAC